MFAFYTPTLHHRSSAFSRRHLDYSYMLLGCLAFRLWIFLVPSSVRYARCMIILNDVVQTAFIPLSCLFSYPFLTSTHHRFRLVFICIYAHPSFILVYNCLLHLLFTLRCLLPYPWGSVLLYSVVPSFPCDISTSTLITARTTIPLHTHSLAPHRTLTHTHLSRHPTHQLRTYLTLIPERPALPRFELDLLVRIGNR